MREVSAKLVLPEGNFNTVVTEFEQSDCNILFDIYNNWIELCRLLNSLNARSVNLPEGLSEPAFCLAKDVWRVTKKINGANSSFDCYNPKGSKENNRIQVKACSVLPDLTSFGPSSVWDRIFFIDFFREGLWDATFDVYELDTNDIMNYPVNAHQTLREQQLEGRRPRFSIYSGLIKKGKYISLNTYKITKEEVIEI